MKSPAHYFKIPAINKFGITSKINQFIWLPAVPLGKYIILQSAPLVLLFWYFSYMSLLLELLCKIWYFCLVNGVLLL